MKLYIIWDACGMTSESAILGIYTNHDVARKEFEKKLRADIAEETDPETYLNEDLNGGVDAKDIEDYITQSMESEEWYYDWGDGWCTTSIVPFAPKDSLDFDEIGLVLDKHKDNLTEMTKRELRHLSKEQNTKAIAERTTKKI